MSQNTPLFNTDGEPNPLLLNILKLFEVEHDGTLTNIRDATQTAWYQAGKLRTEIEERHGTKRDDAMPLFAELGFVGDVNPQCQHYLHALVLGGTVVAVRKRLAFLMKKWNEGMQFNNIHLIASKRPLLPDKESQNVIFNPMNAELPFDVPRKTITSVLQNEADMMSTVYALSQNKFPWGDMKMQLVSAENVGSRPANTEETLTAWNKLSLMGGKCLIVSSQPYVSFQELIARKVLSKRHARIDAIGYDFPGITTSGLLDNLAKVIYELAQQ